MKRHTYTDIGLTLTLNLSLYTEPGTSVSGFPDPLPDAKKMAARTCKILKAVRQRERERARERERETEREREKEKEREKKRTLCTWL